MSQHDEDSWNGGRTGCGKLTSVLGIDSIQKPCGSHVHYPDGTVSILYCDSCADLNALTDEPFREVCLAEAYGFSYEPDPRRSFSGMKFRGGGILLWHDGMCWIRAEIQRQALCQPSIHHTLRDAIGKIYPAHIVGADLHLLSWC